MSYDRFVHIVRRDDKIKAVLTSAKEGRKALYEMRYNAFSAHKPDDDLEEYRRKWREEEERWHLERWPVCKTMST